jgi:hypothetical protein
MTKPESTAGTAFRSVTLVGCIANVRRLQKKLPEVGDGPTRNEGVWWVFSGQSDRRFNLRRARSFASTLMD